jgi:hypothetical protein
LGDERLDDSIDSGWYYQYHRPIDSLERFGCNSSIATGSVGRATLLKTGLAAPLCFAPHFHEKRRDMDHNEAIRKLEHLMLKRADQAQEAAIELEALVSVLPNGKSRQLAELQVKANHKQAKDFRELAQQAKEK